MADVHDNEGNTPANVSNTAMNCEISTSNRLYAIILSASIIVGICGNILGAWVLSQLQKSVPGVRLLKFLAFIDILLLVFLGFEHVLFNMDQLPRSVQVITCGLFTYERPMALTLYIFEIYFTMLIACQRAVAVAKPLQASHYLRRSVINVSIIGILIFSIVLHLPSWFVYTREVYTDEESNTTWISTADTDFLLSEFYVFYQKYVVFTFRAVIPLVFLLADNIIIIIFSRRRVIQSTATRNHDNLVVVNIAIILMSLLTHVSSALEFASGMNLPKITISLVVINCSANFIFYCIFGRSFRNELVKCCGDLCHKGRQME